MMQNNVSYVSLVLMTLMVTACGAVTPVVSMNTPVTPVMQSHVEPGVIPTVVSKIISSETPLAGQYGAVKFTLEAVRNGKNYEILLAYDVSRQGGQKTPYFPQNGVADLANNAILQWVGDVDADGDLEYVVELVFCGVYCSNKVQIIHYDAVIDDYRAFDSFSGYGAEDYIDIDTDGNPEIISQDYDYQFRVGGAGATRWLAPIKIYRYEIEKQKFEVVTNKYPEWVTKDANKFLEEIKSDNENIASFLKLAAYLYDMYVLGKQEEGIKTFHEVCPQYVKPAMKDSNWSCEGYLSNIQKVLSEMNIKNE